MDKNPDTFVYFVFVDVVGRKQKNHETAQLKRPAKTRSQEGKSDHTANKLEFLMKLVFKQKQTQNEIHDGPADPRCQKCDGPREGQIQILSYILMFVLTRSANNKEPQDSAVKKARQEAVLEATGCHILC